MEKAVRISAPYKFVSKEFRPDKTEISVAGATIGGDEFVVMAGPCSVESEKQILESAEIVAKPEPSCCAAAPSSRAPRPTISRAWKRKA